MASGRKVRPPTLLDDLIPRYDVCSRHAIQVAATPGIVYDSARKADLGRPGLVRVLMGIRLIPAWLARMVLCPRRVNGRAVGDSLVGPTPFTLVAESPGEEFVLGIMGRFWTPSGGVVAATAERFREPAPAGLAQAFWNFRVRPDGFGTELSTETRVRCGDEVTRRHFGRYWRIIQPGSTLIRNSMLRHIRRTAERRAIGNGTRMIA
jgi:hypothetical protein